MARKQEELDFQEYLKQIEAGQPVGKIVAGLPVQAQEQRAELEAAEWLLHGQELMAPRPGFVPASRKRLLARLGGPAARQPGVWRSRWLGRFWGHAPGLAHSPLVLAVLLVTLVALILQSGSLLSRSAPTWLPGDFFYPLRGVEEELSLMVNLSAERRAERHIEFAERRLLEAQALVFEGRYEEISGAVADFSHHVDQAVRFINQVSRHDLTKARTLAGSLHVALSRQNQLIAALAQLCPDPFRRDLQRVLAIAQNGLSAVNRIFAPNSGSAVILTWQAPERKELVLWAAKGADRLAFL